MRRLTRFSLLTLVAFVTVVAVWCAFHANRARYERSIERELIQAGAKVDSGLDRITDKPRESTSYEGFLRSVFAQRFIRRVDAKHVKLTPELVNRVWHLPHLESVTYFSCDLTDEHLRSLDSATALECLLLDEHELTDDGLKGIASLRRLRYLYLRAPGTGDATLRLLVTLPVLEEIHLIRTSATGQGVARLACRRTLIKFSADDTPIQDDFLAALADCRNLRHLDLTRVGISDRGIEHFREHPSLSFMNLGMLNLSDASLEVAATIPELKHFRVAGGMTRQGYKVFQAKRPDVQL